MKAPLVAALLSISSLWAGASVAVNNDSPFPLHAQIISADGRFMGAITVNPQQQMTWHSPNLVVDNTALTPFTLVFYCLEGTEYGIVSNVGNGSTILASSSEGRRVCKPQTPADKKEEKKAQEKDPSLQDLNTDQWKNAIYH